MKQLAQAIAICMTFLVTGATLAHEGHGHDQPLDQATAVETASSKMQELIKEGMLDEKWATRPAAGAQLARIEGRQNWIVFYVDTDANVRLELVFTTNGEYVSMAQTSV